MAAWFWRLANGWDHPDYWLVFLLINMPAATAAVVGFYAASTPILLAYVVVCDVRHYVHQSPEHPAILAALTASVWLSWHIRLTPDNRPGNLSPKTSAK